jgi:metal-dependent amidase/aminoacylase/carboxypeptidase family protein/predicted amidohydrolase
MQEVIIAVGLGAASGILGILAYRLRLAWLGWLTLAPLAVAVYLYSPIAAGLAGAVCGALIAAGNRQLSLPAVVRGARLVEAAITAWVALVWGLVFALAAWLWPDGVPVWGVVIMPASAVVLSAAYGRFRAPLYWSWFLGSQDGSLPVVHIARLGSDLAIPALLALSATVPVILLVQLPPSGVTVAVAIASILVIAGALGFGFVSYRRAVARVEQGTSVHIAAVGAAPIEFDPWSPAYRDVDGLIGRCQPLVARAIAEGARLIVLPEAAALVTSQSRKDWLAAISKWAKEADVPVVAGLFDEDLRKNQLVIADETGQIVLTHEKQHPATMFGEPRSEKRTPPALLLRDPFPVSAVTCVDLDYSDLVRPVARAGGVLAVPAHDWDEIFEMHHRSAVRAGVPVVRSAGHGISAVYDAAGRVVARANSLDGPCALVADVPISIRGAKPGGEPGPPPEEIHRDHPAADCCRVRDRSSGGGSVMAPRATTRGRAGAGTIKDRVRAAIEEHSDQFVGLAHEIHARPQLAFAEEYAAARITEVLAESGFAVRTGVFGLPTAFIATTGSGALHVALCAEYDALPSVVLSDRSKSPGLADVWLGPDGQENHGPDLHACGHNLIAADAVAGACGLRGVADEIGLKVSVFGTPDEELPGLPEPPAGIRGGGKLLFLEAGAFEDVHAALMVHPGGTPYGAFLPSKAYLRQRASFSSADSGAGNLGVTEMRLLKEALRRSLTSIHQTPDHYFVRLDRQKGIAQADIGWYGPSLAESLRAREATCRCYEEAAAAAGVAVEVTDYLPYAEMRPDPVLTASYRRNAHALGRFDPGVSAGADLRWRAFWWLGARTAVYSTDMGNVSHVVPAIHPFLGIGRMVFPHSAKFAAQADTDEAARAMLDGGVALAWTALDAATDPALHSHLLDLAAARAGSGPTTSPGS